MKTKFIGLEGFNEIESLSTKKKRTVKTAVQLTATQKTVRFAKRAGSFVAKEVGNNVGKLASFFSDRTANKKSVKAKKPTSLIDKCYLENRTGLSGEQNSSVKDAINGISFTTGKKYAHSAPKTGNITHTVIRKKAIMAVVASLSVIMFSCATVASALDAPSSNTQVITTSQEVYSTTPDTNNNVFTATADEAVSPIGSDAYKTIKKALINDHLHNGLSGLFIDGEFIGATDDADALNAALDKVLVDYRANYDEETTTEFANEVSVISGNFAEEDVMTVSDIIASAEGKFSISLSTDIVYTREVKYETETKYDDSKDTNYEKVKTEGKNGEELVIIRTTFTDGVQTNAVETGTKIISEAVNEVVVKGTKETASGSSTGSFIWPVPYTHNITSYYAWRWGTMHWGIDIAASGVYGQDIVASDGGVVTYAGDDGGGYGYYVIVDHGNGYSTCYAHCSSLAVSTGQYVSQGETIGYIGSTGNSTGPHLHFEVRRGSDKLNPLDFVS